MQGGSVAFSLSPCCERTNKVALEAALSCAFKNGTSFEQSCEVGTSTSRSACRLPAAMHRAALNPEMEFSPLTW